MDLNEENTKKKKTNQAQYNRLVDLLWEKSDIAQNFTKRPPEEVNIFWEHIKDELNMLGEPKRDANGWRKVWSDYKTYIKKKLAANKKEQTATGGGVFKQKTFNSIEESAIALINLNASVEGIGAQTYVTDENTVPSNSGSISINEQNNNTAQPNILPTKRKQKKRPTAIELLAKQVKMQEDFGKDMKAATNILKDVAGNLKRAYRSLDKLNEIENKKFKEMQQQNAEIKKIEIKKLELKAKVLELELQRTNLMLSEK